ncbi:MAG: hypothetical protein COS88_00450 [Chloroflexi bacterium CG07_land_8_20_14_0_80_51_10]|nr:MAG: hypothetical protein COS88_00450 [Chloroflexi bacterium CG07_land_8_20_14_0_80_51_10]
MGNRHRELALNMLDEAREYIEGVNSIQASEKLYKASEEAIKALAEHFGFPEYRDAEEKGRWTAILLFSAVRRLSERFPQVLDWWDHAWFLHVEGFHEARLGMEEVEVRCQYIEKLIALSPKS